MNAMTCWDKVTILNFNETLQIFGIKSGSFARKSLNINIGYCKGGNYDLAFGKASAKMNENVHDFRFVWNWMDPLEKG